MPDRLRLGRIAYTNVAPLETAFDAGVVRRDVELVSGVPTQLNAAMDAGDLDVSPMSAAHYLAHADRYVRVGNLGIVARGNVLSVVLASPVPPSLLGGADIAVAGDSASGRALLQALLRTRYDVRARLVTVPDALGAAVAGHPTLLIGDAAIDATERLAPEAVHDLGRAWHDWTGLPMVFALWAARREVAAARPADVAALALRYAEARAWGDAHRPDVVAAAQRLRPRPAAFYERYFTALDYTIDVPAEAGLAAFGRVLGSPGELLNVAR